MKAKVTLPSVVMAAISTVVGITATPNLSAHTDKATIESCIQHPTGHSLNINEWIGEIKGQNAEWRKDKERSQGTEPAGWGP